MKRRYITTIVLLCILAGLFLYGNHASGMRGKLVYSESLDKVAVTVDGRDLTLRDLAFYVAYEEEFVENQAMEYDPEDTSKYWNGQVDGIFVRAAARNTAIQMGIHDEIFYQLALKDGITLSEEEELSLTREHKAFWQDLVADEKAPRLGVTEEELYESMRRMMFAQKFQYIHAEIEKGGYEDYNFDGKYYSVLLKEHKFTIHKDVWRRVPFGNVTINHSADTKS